MIEISNKKALIAGASGLTGSYLLQLLLADKRYSMIRALVRHPLEIHDPKLEILHSDYSEEELNVLCKADEVFCCLGTTIRKAGSKDAFRKVDYELPLLLAKASLRNGVKTFVVISSVDANPASRNFYLRTKGEMEQAILAMPFEKVIIVRPSMLMGQRAEFRPGELLGKGLIRISDPFLAGRFKKYKGIHVRNLAKAMLRLANTPQEKKIFESHELRKLSRKTTN